MTAEAQGTGDKTPKVSVAMPVRNALPFLDEAIESVLSQSLEDFELVIGDDGSDDGSSQRLEWWASQDARIRLSRRDHPSGPAGSSNWVLEMARSEFVARMDADDVSEPDRLVRQLAILKSSDDIVLTGSTWMGIDAQGRQVRAPDIAALMTNDGFAKPFAHGSVMMRKSAALAVGGYRGACNYWEDADLFLRLSASGRILVSIEPLYRHRFANVSNRLHADQTRLERQLHLQLQCKANYARGVTYECLLDQPTQPSSATILTVMRQRAALSVWAGNRSDIWRGAVARLGLGSVLRQPANALFLYWASLSPLSLRRALAFMVGWRNRRARHRLQGRDTVEWDPPEPA